MKERLFPDVRLSTAADVQALVSLINLAYRVEDFFINGDRTDENDVRARLARPGSAFLVVDAVADGRTANTLAAAAYVEVRGPRGYFAMLSVDPAYQKRGLGTRLVQAVEDYCRTAGCDWLDIEVVNLREELPAFYERFGFAPGGTAPFPDPAKLRREACLVNMSKPIAR